ncbi:MAG: CpaF family protein [Oscillospiraceae bacterium]|nr:CpaF family protein [Oscillospiraceae bacterium]MBR6617717.1 CpaF family protein [Oscillospiraceae bacterium]
MQGMLDENGDYAASDGTLVYITPDDKASIVEQVFGMYRGLGFLETIISDETITEVMVNGPDNIFIEQSGRVRRLEQRVCDDTECSEEERLERGRIQLRKIIHRIVDICGREVNEASPIVDARLKDGSRVNIVLHPIAMGGDTVTIRKFSKKPMSIDRLIAYGSITEEIAMKLKMLVGAKYNIFISGGTGSGKTTFLNALSNYIPFDERVITIEDSAELQITGVDNLVSLETKQANAEGKGAITIKDLIKSSLRMRPERIVVGEVRGEEALDMLQAMNTGHDGSLSTGHANSAKDMLTRLETMVLQGASGLPLDAVRRQIGSALDIIVHLSRMRDHSRKVVEISEVLGYEKGEILMNPIYVFEEDEKSTLERVSGGLVRTKNEMKNVEKLRQAGILENI